MLFFLLSVNYVSYNRLILSSEDEQNKEPRPFVQGMSVKISDMMAKAKVLLQWTKFLRMISFVESNS